LLIGLFLAQRRGTAAIAGAFGPVMLVWFAVLGLLGVWGSCSTRAYFSRSTRPAVLLCFWTHLGVVLSCSGRFFSQ
jgi:KUP system potassium uptake protein